MYALHNESLEKELFDKNGNINADENGEPLGEWDLYFGESSNIRPYLFIPETNTEVKNYICYQVGFDEIPRYSNIQKYNEITFSIFVRGEDAFDKLTGIPRHDLIASIIREKFNWSSALGFQSKLISSKESKTDNNYITKTLIFRISDINGITYTPLDGNSQIRNNEYWS